MTELLLYYLMLRQYVQTYRCCMSYNEKCEKVLKVSRTVSLLVKIPGIGFFLHMCIADQIVLAIKGLPCVWQVLCSNLNVFLLRGFFSRPSDKRRRCALKSVFGDTKADVNYFKDPASTFILKWHCKLRNICKGKGHPMNCLCRQRGDVQVQLHPGTMRWVVSTTLGPLYPSQEFRMLDVSVWTTRKMSTQPGFDPWTDRPVPGESL